MFQSILLKLSQSFQHFGRVPEMEEEVNPWEIPKRDKFYITSEELKTVSLALTHYKKQLKKQRSFDRVERVSELDNRIFHFIAFLEAKEGQKDVLPKMA